ncbi:MAG: metallophosphoesterase [Bacteroidales bacterium]
MKYFKIVLIWAIVPLCGVEVLYSQDLVILHTNDTHSNIEPHRSGINQGLGGFQRISNYISYVRDNHKSVLLLDAGDFNQGTPYYTLFGGKVEVEIFNAIGYDAGALGNHEFDDGQESLAKRIKELNYPILCANYNFKGTPLEGVVEPYTIIERGGKRVAIIGVLVNLKGFVAQRAIEGLHYQNPIGVVNKLAKRLRDKERCDLVIVLSHLGYTSRDPKRVSDLDLAKESRGVDIIIGGHSHTFLEKPTEVKNREGKTVIVNQTGALGVYVGRLDLSF